MRSLWIGLAVTAVVGLAASAAVRAEPPLFPPLPGSSNVISGSGNGVGNSIIVSNSGPGSSSTVVSNVRNGLGNKLVIINNGKQLVVEDPPCYQGKNNLFWNVKVYCDSLGTTLYFSTRDGQWFHYVPADDAYRPVPEAWQYLLDPLPQ